MVPEVFQVFIDPIRVDVAPAATTTTSSKSPGDHLTTWPVLSNENVQFNTPSQADGWTPAQEIQMRKKAARVVFDTVRSFQNLSSVVGCRLTPIRPYSPSHPPQAEAQGVSSGTCHVAVTMFLRFYCRRSMAKDHPFVMALASLFLACKVNNEPRALRGLQVEMLKQWYGRDSSKLRERLDEVDKMQALRETTVRAESMLLMTLDFDLNIDVLLHVASQKIKEIPELLGRFSNAVMQQKLINVCNDVIKNDGTFVLVYSCEKMSIAICHFFCQRNKTLTVPPNNPDGTHWYERYLTVEEMDTINERLLKMYKKITNEKSKTSAATTTATTATNSSGGYAASIRGAPVAARGVQPPVAVGGRGDGVAPPHLQGTLSRMGSLSKSGSPAVTNPSLKRQRSEPEIGTAKAMEEAFRSPPDGYDTQYAAVYDEYGGGYGARHTQSQVDYEDLSPGTRRGPMLAPGRATAAAAATATATTLGTLAAPSAPAGPPSSPEEGEIGLEDGEIE